MGTDPKTSSVGGNERGNGLLFRREREREREVSCEGEDVAGKKEKVHAQYVGRKRAVGIGNINKPAKVRRKQGLLGW